MSQTTQSNIVSQVLIFLLFNLFTGLKMIGGVFLFISAMFAFVGIFLGIPMMSMVLVENGNHIMGSICAVISLIIYGAAFNSTKR